MISLRLYFTGIVLVLISSHGATAQTTQPIAFTNEDANSAWKRYVIADQKDVDEYWKEENALRSRLITELTDLQTKVTKAGNLDQALQIKDAIAELRKGHPDVSGATPQGAVSKTSYVGVWQLTFVKPALGTDLKATDKPHVQYTLLPNGDIQAKGQNVGKWKATDDGVTLAMHWNSWVETFNFDTKTMSCVNQKGATVQLTPPIPTTASK